MNTDRFGLRFTTSSHAAASAYVDAVDRLLAADGGAIEALEAAVQLDPGFALAHTALARAYQISGQGQNAQAAIEHATALCDGLGERERGHVHALAAVVHGRAEALTLVRAHIDRFPRDALVLAPGVAVFGLIGFSGRQGRNEELLQWMRQLEPHYHDDWWFAAWYGFLHTETGAFEQGRVLAQQAFARNPRNANAMHAMVHACYEGDNTEAGAELLATWLPRYSAAAPLHCHLSWHLALFALELGQTERAWHIFSSAIAPRAATQAPPINALTDSAAFLWRAGLMGQRVSGSEWTALVDFAAKHFAVGALDFVDVHVVMALVGAGESEKLKSSLARLRAHEGRGGDIAHALSQGLAAYGARDWARAAEVLQSRADELVRVGGSGAQRDVFEHTLLAAWLRAGQAEQAKQWLASRPRRPRHDSARVLQMLAP